jgi:hypothetical protein
LKIGPILAVLLLVGSAQAYTVTLKLEILINDEKANSPPGPSIPVGDAITWNYKIKNAGDVSLSEILVTDSTLGVNPTYRSGDINENGLLEPGEVWIFEAIGIAEAGQHEDTVKARGVEKTWNNSVGDRDICYYYGVPDNSSISSTVALPSGQENLFLEEGTSQAASAYKVLYSDDFSDINSGWSKKSSSPKESEVGYEDGKYLITVFRENGSASAWLKRDFNDFVIEVEATKEGGPDGNGYGVILRRLEDNFYRFEISGDGYYQFDKRQDGKWIDIIPWTRSITINTGEATNVIKVECNGDEFAFYVNGVELGICTDESFIAGEIGLEIGTLTEGGSRVSFDNLKVWAIGSDLKRYITC